MDLKIIGIGVLFLILAGILGISETISTLIFDTLGLGGYVFGFILVLGFIIVGFIMIIKGLLRK